jgi:hypothetical protein
MRGHFFNKKNPHTIAIAPETPPAVNCAKSSPSCDIFLFYFARVAVAGWQLESVIYSGHFDTKKKKKKRQWPPKKKKKKNENNDKNAPSNYRFRNLHSEIVIKCEFRPEKHVFRPQILSKMHQILKKMTKKTLGVSHFSAIFYIIFPPFSRPKNPPKTIPNPTNNQKNA